jgi:hypothetical protein
LKWVINALETESEFTDLENTNEDSHLPVIFIDSIGRQSQLVFLKPIDLEQQAQVMIHFTEQDGLFENTESFDPEAVFLSYDNTIDNLKSQGQEYLEEIVEYVKDNYESAGVNTEIVPVSLYDSQYIIRKDFTNTDFSVYNTVFEEPSKVLHLNDEKVALFVYLYNEEEITNPPKNLEMLNNHNFIELFASDVPSGSGSIPKKGLSIYARMNNWVNNVVTPEFGNGKPFNVEEHKDMIKEKSHKYITPAMICNNQFMCTEIVAMRILHGENNINNRTGIDWTKLEMTYHNLKESELLSPDKEKEIEPIADKEHIFYASQFNHLIGMTIVKMTEKLEDDYEIARTSPNRTSQKIEKDGAEKEDVPPMYKTTPPEYVRRNEFDLFLDNFKLRERELQDDHTKDRDLSQHDMIKSIEDNPDFDMPTNYFFKKNHMVIIFVGYKEKQEEISEEKEFDKDDIFKRNLLIM